MPIYEYGCDRCGHQFEVFVRSKADLPGKCPACGAGRPVKSMSSFAVTTHGSSPCAACPAGVEAESCGSHCGGGCHF